MAGPFTKTAAQVFAGTDAAGKARAVNNHDAQVWGTEVERAFALFQAGGGVVFTSKAEADASLDYDANTMAWVTGDDDDAGLYQKQGASGSGSWVRVGDLPYSFIRAENVGAGTANAIQATTTMPIPQADGGALIALPIAVDNTADAPTVSFNGGPALTITDAAGIPVGAGGLTAGMLINGYVVGSTFRADMGPRGWSPLLRAVSDGQRRVLELYDWTGGHGAKPSETGYIGPSGLTSNIAEATDLRGPEGPSGDGTGDMVRVQYDPRSIAADAFELSNQTADGNPVGETGLDLAASETEDDARQALGIIVPTLISSAPPTSPFDIPVVTKTDMLVTVGPGGNYATINEAVEALSYYMPAYVQRGMQAEIRLLSGFVMAEQLEVHGQNYCWMNITSEDAEVVIQSSALTSMGGSYRPAFRVEEGGGLPVISTLFNMDDSGSEDNYAGVQVLVKAYARIAPGAGVKNAGARGLHTIGGIVYAEESIWDGAGDIGCRIGNNSLAGLRRASAQNCRNGFRIAGASSVLAQSASVSNSEADGLAIQDGSICDASGLQALNCGDWAIEARGPACIELRNHNGSFTNVSGSNNGILAAGAARVSATGAIAENCTGTALSAAYGGTLRAENAIARNSNQGVVASDGSTIIFAGGDASGSTGGNEDIRVIRGSFITAHGATGSLSQTANSLTNQGAIFT